MTNSKNLRVLLVEDSEEYRMFLRRNLLTRNFEIVGEAGDGEQGVKLFQSEKPDLTLLDFEMPIADGSEVLDEIKTINPDAVVIMLTGREDMETMELCIDKGASHYIRKEYPLELIFSVIDESLAKV